MQLSSPTPHLRPARTLVPSSPATHPRSGTYNRNRLRATSSSEGLGSIKGLSNWRREAKPRSGASAISSADATRGRGENRTSKSGSESGTAGEVKNSAARRTLSGKRGRGLGMGMAGTPAKKVKRSSKISIGTHSTPLRQSQARTYLTSNIDSDIDPDADESRKSLSPVTPSSSPRLSSASAKQDTSPSISEPSVSPIIARTGHSHDLRFNSYDSLFSPSDIQGGDDDELESGEDTFSPAARDMLVPLNDLSSAPSLPRSATTSADRQINAVGAGKDDELLQNEAESQQSVDDEKTPTRTRLYDYSVPLNDLSTPMRDRFAALNDITPRGRVSSTTTSKSKTPSRASSKISARQSTPYRLPSMDRKPPPSDSITGTDVDESNSHFQLAQEDGLPDDTRSDDMDLALNGAFREGTLEFVSSPGKHARTEDEVSLSVETSRRPSPQISRLSTGPVTPPRAASSPTPANVTLELGSFGALSPSLFQARLVRNQSPHISRSSQKSLRSALSDDSFSGGRGSQNDPFGFEQMEKVLKHKRPQPYRASSEASSILGPPSPSPISFASLTPERSDSANETTDSASHDSSYIVTPSLGRRGITGRWRGAEILKRMQGEMASGKHDRRDPYVDLGNGIPEGMTDDHHHRNSDRARQKSSAPETPEDVLQARQARIRHYEDLKLNYKLHVEYVLW
ncbi:hypothetical protein I316_05281 [Kwoniella heveanensis BCC8398]|uniref:Uncharacterized protein n=1 Tax=Kwoniella heveanensis BCC8398 TaxID=1296120 RepID=A0A1B9GPA6_9TREE|nr:hypothetical protein I316_05281 [Kwoniella heveanensis BCC8398]